MENLVIAIGKMIKAQARKYIDESETYSEARQKVRNKMMVVNRHGRLGSEILEGILNEIENEAINQPVKPLLESIKK